MNPPRRREDETTSTDHDRIIRLEADQANCADRMDRLEVRIGDTLDKIEAKVESLPSDKSIRLLIENEVHNRKKTKDALTDWRIWLIVAMGGGGTMGIKALLEKLVG